jgi:putative drug exporter of the RND superfamily
MLIGVGVDYALLVLTRFRSALDDGKDTHDAVIEAVTTAGRSVLIAGSTVIIALLGLFFVGLSYMHGVALAASLSVLTVMVGAITLLPALLSFAGHRVNSLRIPSSAVGARRARPVTRRRFAGAASCSAIPGDTRSPQRSCCWRSPRPRWACASGLPMPETTRPGR